MPGHGALASHARFSYGADKYAYFGACAVFLRMHFDSRLNLVRHFRFPVARCCQI